MNEGQFALNETLEPGLHAYKVVVDCTMLRGGHFVFKSKTRLLSLGHKRMSIVKAILKLW